MTYSNKIVFDKIYWYSYLDVGNVISSFTINILSIQYAFVTEMLKAIWLPRFPFS